ncbi:YceI family protein [Aestuariibaculum suncheonense]|uniref:YceI family protein n=1 Tax=Aestuariibaculum suncheonense TaxID=1028745 RepID=A0A8J6UBF8_9FLAO|nr:YceI family protein [Aestuariibaculum suncheonense]MBD0835427.1 YceI family protein [Aestuariibaculum suncheonense]
MRRVVFVVFILAALAFTKTDTAVNTTSVVVSSKSTLVVKGTTNVNAFSCVFDSKRLKNPISVTYFSNGQKLKFKETALVLDNGCFDCGGKGINRDFQKILKSETYPQIKLILKETSSLEDKSDVQTLVDVEIAGIKKEYKIPVTVRNNGTTLINGGLKVCLSDYNLEQPKKMFGLITVDDEIHIDFNLVVE